MILNVTYDKNVDQATKDAFGQVVSFFEHEFTNPVTVNLTVRYGDNDGNAIVHSTFVTQGVSYADLRAAFLAHQGTDIDASASASLPGTDPISGPNHMIMITQAEAKALGLSLNYTGSDGSITIQQGNTYDLNPYDGIDTGSYDFVGGMAHELAEIMGRAANLGANVTAANGTTYSTVYPFDYFRYSASGVRALSSTTPAYASADGGITKIKDFNSNPSGDFHDWAPSGHPDPFDAFAGTGDALPISEADLRTMDLLGWTRASLDPSDLHGTGGVVDPSSTAPYVQSNTIAVDGQSFTPNGQKVSLHLGESVQIEVDFDRAVTVSGLPALTLNNGGKAVFDAAATARLYDAHKLAFTYTASAQDQDAAGLAFTGIDLSHGALQDANGANLDLTKLPTVILAGSNFPGIEVHTQASELLGTYVQSIDGDTTLSTGDLDTGHVIKIGLNFSHPVAISGIPQLTLNTGGSALYDAAATAATGNPNVAVFTYTVGPHDAAVSALAVEGISTAGSILTDDAGNPADLSGAIGRSFGGLQIHVPTILDGPPVALGTAGTLPSVLLPQVATFADGKFVESWIGKPGDYSRPDGSNVAVAQLFAADGTALAAPIVVASIAGDSFHNVPLAKSSTAVATLGPDSFVVAWADGAHATHADGEPSTRVYGQIYDTSGAAHGPAFLLGGASPNDESMPKVAALSGGGFVATWMDWAGSTTVSRAKIEAQVFDAHGNKVGGLIDVGTSENPTSEVAAAPTVAALSNGGFAVSWTGSDAILVAGQEFGYEGVTGTTKAFDPTGLAGEVTTFQYAFPGSLSSVGLRDGGYAVAYDGGNGPEVRIFDALGNQSGATISVAELQDNKEYVYSTAITQLANGDLFASYGAGQAIKGQEIDLHGNKVGSERALLGDTTSDGYAHSQVAALASGGLIATAEHQDNGASQKFVPAAPNAGEITLPTSITVQAVLADGSVPAVPVDPPAQAGNTGQAFIPVKINIPYDLQQGTVTYSVEHGSVAAPTSDSGDLRQFEEPGYGVTYMAQSGFHGTDTLTVRVIVGGVAQVATVPIVVDAPLTGQLLVTHGAGPAGDVFGGIYGPGLVGTVLTADTSRLADADGMGTLHYAWCRVAEGGPQTPNNPSGLVYTPVGTDASSYQVTSDDVGHAIRLVVSFVDGNGTPESTFNDTTLFTANPAGDYPDAPVILTPSTGSTVASARPVITGTGTPGDSVDINIDAGYAGKAHVGDDGKWSYQLYYDLTNSSHTITAMQEDANHHLSAGVATQTFAIDTRQPVGAGPQASDLSIPSGSQIDLGTMGTNPVGALVGSGTLTSTTGPASLSLAPSAGSSSTFAGQIKETSGHTINLTLDSSGTQILANTNTYSGPTTIKAGTLMLQHATGGSVDAVGSGTVALQGGTLSISTGQGATLPNSLDLGANASGGGTIASTDPKLVLSGEISGAGSLILTGTEIDLTHSNPNFIGSVFLNSGTVVLGNSVALGSATTHLIDPTLQFGATGTYANNLVLDVAAVGSGAAQTTANDPATLTVGSGVTATLTGQISTGTRNNALGAPVDPNQPLVVSGLGAGATLVLGGLSANSYSGGTTLQGSLTLDLAKAGAAGSGSITFTAAGQTLQVETVAVGSGSAHMLANQITGFALGDLIDLAGIGTAAAATYSAGQVIVTGGTQTETLSINAAPSGYQYSVASDGHGGTKVLLSAVAASPDGGSSGGGTPGPSGGGTGLPPTTGSPGPAPDPAHAAFFGSVAHDPSSAGGEVYALYHALLGRAPDPLGLELHAAELQTGMSLQDLARSILTSPEYQSSHGGPQSSTAFVQDLYRTALHRDPDPAGLQFWSDALDHGTSPAQIASQIALSTEAQHVIQNGWTAGVFVPDPTASQVARLYYGLLGRAPDAGGLQAFTANVEHGGQSLSQVAQAFVSSPEFLASHADLSDSGFVDLLYTGALGRHAEPAGLLSWTQALAQGATRADVAIAIAESPEAQTHLLSQIEAGYHLF